MKKILLVGNYEADRQYSMLRYADWLERRLRESGYSVSLRKPARVFGRLTKSSGLLFKWLGYLDKLVLFPLHLLFAARRCDLVHICDHSNAYYRLFVPGKPLAVTCHDLIGVQAARGEFPGQRVGFSGRVLQGWVVRSLRRIRNVCVVSEATREIFARIIGGIGHDVACIPNPVLGFAPVESGAAIETLRRNGVAVFKPFILHVGSDLWYKNRGAVAAIFFRLAREPRFADLQLVFAGAPLSVDARQGIAAARLDGRITEVVAPTAEVLRALYSSAEALLFPSLTEGFGWPIVEAQACGCPVITSDREPMRGVAGPAALLVDPENAERAADRIAEEWTWLMRQRAASLENAELYSEQRIFDRYLKFYERVLHVAPGVPALHSSSVDP